MAEDEDTFDDLVLLEDAIYGRHFRKHLNPIEHFNDGEFLARYRLTKEVVSELNEFLMLNKGNRSIDVSSMLQLCIALRFYASGNLQASDGDLAGVHLSTVSRIIENVSRSIAQHHNRFIRMPPSGLETYKSRFYEVAGIPSVIGALDGTHIPIISQGGAQAEVYRNRKGIFSLNVQCLCDPSGVFTVIVCRWPGSSHDATIFSNSRLCHNMEERNYNGFLLGDNGYACKRYLLTPVLNPMTQAERRFNSAHTRTRQIIECAFGQWKQRFRCLKYLRLKLQNSLTTIVATACLHNIAKERSIPLPGTIENSSPQEDEVVRSYVPETYGAGAVARQQIINLYFNN